jgi:hypothetical protein
MSIHVHIFDHSILKSEIPIHFDLLDSLGRNVDTDGVETKPWWSYTSKNHHVDVPGIFPKHDETNIFNYICNIVYIIIYNIVSSPTRHIHCNISNIHCNICFFGDQGNDWHRVGIAHHVLDFSNASYLQAISHLLL